MGGPLGAPEAMRSPRRPVGSAERRERWWEEPCAGRGRTISRDLSQVSGFERSSRPSRHPSPGDPPKPAGTAEVVQSAKQNPGRHRRPSRGRTRTCIDSFCRRKCGDFSFSSDSSTSDYEMRRSDFSVPFFQRPSLRTLRQATGHRMQAMLVRFAGRFRAIGVGVCFSACVCRSVEPRELCFPVRPPSLPSFQNSTHFILSFFCTGLWPSSNARRADHHVSFRGSLRFGTFSFLCNGFRIARPLRDSWGKGGKREDHPAVSGARRRWVGGARGGRSTTPRAPRAVPEGKVRDDEASNAAKPQSLPTQTLDRESSRRIASRLPKTTASRSPSGFAAR